MQYNIIRPGDPIKFTDKIRANSGAKCYAAFPRIVQPFDFNGTEEAIPKLCDDILDFLEKYYTNFLTMVKTEYGDLGTYYIVNRDGLLPEERRKC